MPPTLIIAIAIDLGLTAVLVVLGYRVGYHRATRFAADVATTVLTKLDLDLDPQPDKPLTVFASPLAKFIAALYRRPASAHRVQADLDDESRIHRGETWRTARSRRP